MTLARFRRRKMERETNRDDSLREEDRIGVFSWCVKREFRKLFCFVTRDLKVLRGPWWNWITNPFTPKSDLIDFTLSNARRFYSSKGDPLGVKGLTDIRDFTTLIFETEVLRMIRVVYAEWLRYAICNMDPWSCLSRFCFLQSLI